MSKSGPVNTGRSRRINHSARIGNAPQQKALLSDHLVGAGEHGCRNVEAERLRGLQINDQLVLSWRLAVGRLLALEDAVNVAEQQQAPEASVLCASTLPARSRAAC
jgi:hypothetical protein